MFSSYEGAKRLAKKLQKTMADLPLGEVQNAIARAAGFRDWHHLKSSEKYKLRRDAFERRLHEELPGLEAITGANRVHQNGPGLTHSEQREIEEIWRREVLSSLPDTIEELIEVVAGADVEEWAEAFGVTSKCMICGTSIVHAFSFAEAAVQYYDLSADDADIAHAKIEEQLLNSATETGGWGDGSLCAYHNEQAAKDD